MLTEEEETAYLQFFKRAAVYHVNNTNVSWGPIVKSYLEQSTNSIQDGVSLLL